MNYNGCKQSYGTVLAFRLKDSRAILIGSGICIGASKAFDQPRPSWGYNADYRPAMRQHKRIDVADYCYDLTADRDPKLSAMYRRYYATWQGYLVDNADKPTRGEPFNFGSKLKSSDTTIRLVSATAQAMDVSPRDNLDKVVPGVLRAQFQPHDYQTNPGNLIYFSRRSNEYVATRY
jgi:hypothetical protein